MKLTIKDKYTNKPLIQVDMSKDASCDKVANVAMSMLPLLYSMGRKGKAQIWVIPKTFGAKMQLAFNWGTDYKNHPTLFKIPAVYMEDELCK